MFVDSLPLSRAFDLVDEAGACFLLGPILCLLLCHFKLLLQILYLLTQDLVLALHLLAIADVPLELIKHLVLTALIVLDALGKGLYPDVIHRFLLDVLVDLALILCLQFLDLLHNVMVKVPLGINELKLAFIIVLNGEILCPEEVNRRRRSGSLPLRPVIGCDDLAGRGHPCRLEHLIHLGDGARLSSHRLHLRARETHHGLSSLIL